MSQDPFTSRQGLERWARLICEEEGAPVPPLVWTAQPHAKCLRRSVVMPSPEYLDEQDPDHEWYRLPALLLHELAHWVAYRREGRIRHSPLMYAILFRLSDRWALPTDVLREWERAYKPRASVAGWRLYRSGRA